MKTTLLLTLLLISGLGHSQTFNMQYSKTSANEVQVVTVYTGPSAEINLPRTGRIIALSEQNDLNVGGGSIRVGIRVGGDDTQEHTVRFTYSLILPNQGGYGSISGDWYPTIRDVDVEYKVSSLAAVSGMFVYPYAEFENNAYTFYGNQNAKLAVFNHSIEEHTDGAIPITVFSANQLQSSPQEILALNTYMNENFGKKDIQRIIIVNSALAYENSFIADETLYLHVTGMGNTNQLRTSFITAWRDNLPENLSTRLFNMFLDTVLRLAPLTSAQEETTKDLGQLVLIPPTSYYEELFVNGFENNEIKTVDAEGLFNNYALLHMAQYNIGADSLLAGIKAYFNGEADAVEEIPTPATTEEGEEVATTESTEVKKDTDYINWSVVTQNKLQEPLFSLYTKEVLVERGILPVLTANGTVVSRNSYNIPDLNIVDANGDVVEILWNNFRSVNISITNGSYQLDTDRIVPQQSFFDSYYSFDASTTRIQILSMADRIKAPGEISLRKHLEVVRFTAEDNAFGVEAGTDVYVVISHIYSNSTGAMKSAVKESFFSVDFDGKITHISTRVRV